jgi:aryl-alcohol dehydrogenase-like predicted oxidoreductase
LKLALGAVQFGLEYGIANQSGRVRPEDVKSILENALAQGVDTLDTAIAYGNSESAIGQAGAGNWRIVTKLPAISDGCNDVAGWVEAQIEGSLERLGIGQLHAVLLHRPEQLLGKLGRSLAAALEDLKEQGITRKIGVSVYGPEQLDSLMSEMQFDLVQMPLNILDRRFVESDCTKKLKTRGVELHVRSVFLQGLLLMRPAQRPEKFARWQPVWAEWARWLDETGLTPLQGCLGYALGVEEVDKVVVGVDSVKQLQEIFVASHSPLPSLPNWPQPLDADLINPSRWTTI